MLPSGMLASSSSASPAHSSTDARVAAAAGGGGGGARAGAGKIPRAKPIMPKQSMLPHINPGGVPIQPGFLVSFAVCKGVQAS